MSVGAGCHRVSSGSQELPVRQGRFISTAGAMKTMNKTVYIGRHLVNCKMVSF